MKPFNKSRIDFFLIGLIILAGVSFYYSNELLIRKDSGLKWYDELGKSLLSLAMTAVVGGIVKLVFDARTKKQTARENIKTLKRDILNRLREVFDNVDTSRLLMAAHRSAKTYGEQLRQNVIASIPKLYDIKRSLVDSEKALGLDPDLLILLRVNIHYMIAYLTALSLEYKEGYIEMSNLQYFQEAAKDKLKEQFKQEYSESKLKDLLIPDVPEFAWERISEAKYLKDFLSDSNTSMYTQYFIDYYESVKKQLKDIYRDEQIKNKLQKEKKYVAMLKVLDKIRKNKDENDNNKNESDLEEKNIEGDDNLVVRIMKEKMGFSPKHI